MNSQKTTLRLALVVLSILASAVLGGCAAAADQHTYAMASLRAMPGEVRAAPVVVRQAYQFAVANPDVLTKIPCYCGCGEMGHTSNYACYVAGYNPDGALSFDLHAIGCSICVDITQDAMRLLDQGKSAEEIKTYVDANYSQFGPSNMP